MAILRANNNTLSSVTALPTAISTGSLVKLSSSTASSSSEIVFDNTVFTSTYKSYLIRINDFVLSTNTSFFSFLFNRDSLV